MISKLPLFGIKMGNTALKTTAKRIGWTLLWCAWLYPFVRFLSIVPMLMLQYVLKQTTFNKVQAYVMFFHGGRPMYDFLMSWYIGLFVLSVILYLLWHYKTKTRIRWGARIILPLVFVFNTGYPIFAAHVHAETARLEAEATAAEENYIPPMLGTEEAPPEEPARQLFLPNSQ